MVSRPARRVLSRGGSGFFDGSVCKKKVRVSRVRCQHGKTLHYQRKERFAWVTGWSGLQGNPAVEDGRVWFDGRHGLQVMKDGFHGSPAVGEEPPLPEERVEDGRV